MPDSPQLPRQSDADRIGALLAEMRCLRQKLLDLADDIESDGLDDAADAVRELAAVKSEARDASRF